MTWTAADMLELGTRHATLEAKGNIAGTMQTLIDRPVYEFHPMGLTMTGTDMVRRYYEHLIGNFIPMTRGYELLEEWGNASSIGQEYAITTEADGQVETHRVVGILFASGELLGGERLYASEHCFRLMAGDALIDELIRD
jgi:hypothetical protein